MLMFIHEKIILFGYKEQSVHHFSLCNIPCASFFLSYSGSNSSILIKQMIDNFLNRSIFYKNLNVVKELVRYELYKLNRNSQIDRAFTAQSINTHT